MVFSFGAFLFVFSFGPGTDGGHLQQILQKVIFTKIQKSHRGFFKLDPDTNEEKQPNPDPQKTNADPLSLQESMLRRQ